MFFSFVLKKQVVKLFNLEYLQKKIVKVFIGL